jgi:phosphopantetheinyl transferase (holo-ACP synthase)
MPIRPFPFSFRIGTDICRVDRIRRIICARQSPTICTRSLDRFLRKVLTDSEIKTFRSAKAGVSCSTVIAEHLAGRYMSPCLGRWAAKASRWAAKEAIIKAYPRKLFMRDIIVRPGPDSIVGLILDPATENGQTAANGSSGQEVLLSISHEREYAIATAVMPV